MIWVAISLKKSLADAIVAESALNAVAALCCISGGQPPHASPCKCLYACVGSYEYICVCLWGFRLLFLKKRFDDNRPSGDL